MKLYKHLNISIARNILPKGEVLRPKCPIGHRKIKLSHNKGCLKTRSDTDCYSPAFNKQEHWRNIEDTKHMKPIMCQFCPCCVKFFRLHCLLNAGEELSRSNLVFEIRNNYIFGMLYFLAVIPKPPIPAI